MRYDARVMRGSLCYCCFCCSYPGDYERTCFQGMSVWHLSSALNSHTYKTLSLKNKRFTNINPYNFKYNKYLSISGVMPYRSLLQLIGGTGEMFNKWTRVKQYNRMEWKKQCTCVSVGGRLIPKAQSTSVLKFLCTSGCQYLRYTMSCLSTTNCDWWSLTPGNKT